MKYPFYRLGVILLDVIVEVVIAKVGILFVGLVLVPTGTVWAQETTAPGACRPNAVVVLQPGDAYENACPGVRYVVQEAYFERALSGYASGRTTAPLVERSLAERDSLIEVLEVKTVLLDSTRQALVQLSGALSEESVRALTTARDLIDTAVLPELRAAQRDLEAASASLRRAERRLFWSRLATATVPALAGVAIGLLITR